MPSQHDYLVDDGLREGLRRGEPSAEARLVRRFNRGRRPEARLPLPSASGDYDAYDGRLLALLWALAGNTAALLALARKHGWARPDPPTYADMPDALAAFLWTWGRDAETLETLWTRCSRLPVTAVDADTPDAVLGFLWWRHRRPEARDELFRRHHLGGPGDAAQDRALTLLLVIDRWDYERYPTPDSLLAVSAAHRRIDAARRRARSPRVDQTRAEEADSPDTARPGSGVEARDFLEVNVPLELRCLHKLRENSEALPLDLTAEELDYLARRNLACAGEEAGGPPLARERTRIAEWSARHPEPTEEQLRQCLPWFRQSGLARQTRLWRLHWRADENNRLLAPLLAGGDDTLIDLACRVQENMDELARRVAAAGRGEGGKDKGPVLLFAELEEAVGRLRGELQGRSLHNGRLGRAGAWLANARAFLDDFPILTKLAACRRLVYALLHAGSPPEGVPLLHRLCDWLDGGQWLSSFGKEDRAESALFSRRLAALRDRFADGHREALDLLSLWLEATQQPGEPPRRLLDADRAWRLNCCPLSAVRDPLAAEDSG